MKPFSGFNSRGEMFASYAKGIAVESIPRGVADLGETDSPIPRGTADSGKGVCRIRGHSQIFNLIINAYPKY